MILSSAAEPCFSTNKPDQAFSFFQNISTDEDHLSEFEMAEVITIGEPGPSLSIIVCEYMTNGLQCYEIREYSNLVPEYYR
jgi:hypothetical protein